MDQDFCSCGDSGRTMLPAASRNQAAKMYHEEFADSPGIGKEIGNAARIPSIARQAVITNKAIFGARNIRLSQLCADEYVL